MALDCVLNKLKTRHQQSISCIRHAQKNHLKNADLFPPLLLNFVSSFSLSSKMKRYEQTVQKSLTLTKDQLSAF